MKRPLPVWLIFSAALALAIGVMLFFTLKLLDDERRMAAAQANAALEETVRLALWRMDSTAAVLLHQPPDSSNLLNSNAPLPQQQNVAQRFDPAYQQAISNNEMQSRESLETRTSTDWHQIAPTLLSRISDILPGAKLEPIQTTSPNPNDTRQLATIPARLVVPASALPTSALPWNTPARISLMAAWLCAAIAALAIARLLSATLSLSARRGAFASAVTHELRTPLTTFRMYAEMLATGMIADPQQRQNYLDTLLAESDRLAHLIENVLAYSRLENHLRPQPTATPITAEQLIHHALPAPRRRTDQAHLALHLNLADPQTTCRADPIAVGQILANLVDNACKYGHSAIELTSRRAHDNLEIAITNQGPPIPPQRARQLFQPFDKSKSDPIPGIGLGLYVSRQLAQNLNGKLEYRPSDTGVTFVLCLPAC